MVSRLTSAQVLLNVVAIGALDGAAGTGQS